jgi:hypothetical protein
VADNRKTLAGINKSMSEDRECGILKSVCAKIWRGEQGEQATRPLQIAQEKQRTQATQASNTSKQGEQARRASKQHKQARQARQASKQGEQANKASKERTCCILHNGHVNPAGHTQRPSKQYAPSVICRQTAWLVQAPPPVPW